MNKSKKTEDEKVEEKKKVALTFHPGVESNINIYIVIYIHIFVMTAVKKKKHTRIHMVIE